MKRLLYISVLLLSSFTTFGQVNYKVHSLFIYKFTQYVEWPTTTGDFIIGVVGNSPIISELEAVAANKKAGTRTIILKKLSADADFSSCNMLFISEESSKKFKDIMLKTSSKPILIITEKDGLGKKGSCVNFIIVDERIKFEINKAAIESQGLKISNDILKLAIVVG